MRKKATRGVSAINVDTKGSHTNTSFVTVTTDLYCQNVSVSDLIMTNEKPTASPNIIDGTTGHWVFQEGSDDIYIINKKNDKKYKIMLQEV